MEKEVRAHRRNKKTPFSEHLEMAQSFEGNGNISKLKERMFHHWEEINETVSPEKMTAQYYRLYYRIMKEKEAHQVITRRRFLRWGSVAAAFFIAAVSTLSWYWGNRAEFSSELVSMESPMGVRTKFYLPDGSWGWLNGGSSLTYAQEDNKRLLALSGKAFFDVSHDEEHPFRVMTRDLAVEVLGTEFGVSSYPDDPESEVTLQKGRVAVSIASDKEVRFLKPDQHFSFNRETKEVSITNIDSQSKLSWIDGRLVFINTPMKEVVKILERNYFVSIDVVDQELWDYSFYGTIDNESVEGVLEIMQLAIPLRFSVKDRALGDDGNYEKRQINLYKK